jgi:hypothetical protein
MPCRCRCPMPDAVRCCSGYRNVPELERPEPGSAPEPTREKKLRRYLGPCSCPCSCSAAPWRRGRPPFDSPRALRALRRLRANGWHFFSRTGARTGNPNRHRHRLVRRKSRSEILCGPPRPSAVKIPPRSAHERRRTSGLDPLGTFFPSIGTGIESVRFARRRVCLASLRSFWRRARDHDAIGPSSTSTGTGVSTGIGQPRCDESFIVVVSMVGDGDELDDASSGRPDGHEPICTLRVSGASPS